MVDTVVSSVDAPSGPKPSFPQVQGVLAVDGCLRMTLVQCRVPSPESVYIQWLGHVPQSRTTLKGETSLASTTGSSEDFVVTAWKSNPFLCLLNSSITSQVFTRAVPSEPPAHTYPLHNLYPREPKVRHLILIWGTIPSVGNVAQPPLGKASGEQGSQAGPTPTDRFSCEESGPHCT